MGWPARRNEASNSVGMAGQGERSGAPGTFHWPRAVKAAVLGLVGLVAAWSWLFAVSRWGPANRIEILTFKAGLSSELTRTLLKQGQGAGGHRHGAAMVSALYATPEYYTMTEQPQAAAKYRPDEFHVFYVFEDIHVGELSREPLEVVLQRDDGRRQVPTDKQTIRDSYHHRATVVRFRKFVPGSPPLRPEATSTLTLVTHDPSTHSLRTMQWVLPLVYPSHRRSDPGFSLGTLLAFLAGLMAVLSPCLLQLTLYYTFALAGVGLASAGADFNASRARIVRAALSFVAGYTAVFTLCGAAAGLLGEQLQRSGFVGRSNRPLAVAAGLGIVALGLWVGARAGAPGWCRMPFGRLATRSGGWLDRAKMVFLGSAFAIGCSTCFGGALFISLMIYVGSVGSAPLGALALFLFSLGMAVPYLLAAVFLARALPILSALRPFSAVAGLASSVALIFFGIILITDTFHVPSDWLYRLFVGL